MELTHHEELQLFALLAAGAALLVLVPVLRVPYPILLVLGGLAMGVLPGLPDVELPPDLVLVAYLVLLVRMKQSASERRAKVHYLPSPPAGSALVLRRSSASS